MLDVEPSKRPTALQVLQHPWMTTANPATIKLNLHEKHSSTIKVLHMYSTTYYGIFKFKFTFPLL